jgi:hypothetical protein
LRFSTIDLLRKEFCEKDIKEQAREKSTERTKCTLALSAMVTGGSVLAARHRDDAFATIFGTDRYRLLDALAWPGRFDCDEDRHGSRFGCGWLCRVQTAIAPVAGVPPPVVLPPDLAVIHRVPPGIIIVVLPPLAFVHRVVAAKFKPALPATRPRHCSARLSEKQGRYGSHRECDLFHKIIIQ